MISIKQLTTTDPNFWAELEQLLAWDAAADDQTLNVVREIIANVRREGDSALLSYTQRFDRRELQEIQDVIISQERLQQALAQIEPPQRQALENAAQRIRDYHQHQVQQSWQYVEADGTLLGQQVTALEKVGLYVPGGKATYPSSVLMNAIPAKVAGVETLIMVVPAPDGVLNDMVLAAAAIAGVDQVFSIGGAQAVAALAYGTETVPKVDKIVGPGNIYVATAKSLVFGAVGIDMIAGPSEILVICDGKTDPDWIAMDLFSQAEHDELARSVLLTPDTEFLTAVQNSIERLLPTMPRAEIIQTSLTTRGLLIQVTDLDDAVEVANFIAPEHLELSVEDAPSWVKKIRNAGAIFMGRYTAEAIGDYCAGPNHVLPTARTARFSSPLGVYDFQKRSSLIMCSPNGADTLGRLAATLAYSEGLTAHAHSAEYRLISK